MQLRRCRLKNNSLNSLLDPLTHVCHIFHFSLTFLQINFTARNVRVSRLIVAIWDSIRIFGPAILPSRMLSGLKVQEKFLKIFFRIFLKSFFDSELSKNTTLLNLPAVTVAAFYLTTHFGQIIMLSKFYTITVNNSALLVISREFLIDLDSGFSILYYWKVGPSKSWSRAKIRDQHWIVLY